MLIAKIWTRIVPLNKAYDLNLLSALVASIGLTFWYLFARLALQNIFPKRSKLETGFLAAISTLVLGVSFSYSIQAVRFEVYSMNFACFAILLYLATKLPSRSRAVGYLCALASVLVTVIALGGHHFTIALAFPGIIIMAFRNGKLNLRRLIYLIAASVILLIPLYLTIMLLARKGPSLNWGDPSNWSNYLDYFFLREFDKPLSSLSPVHLAQDLWFGIKLLVKQVGFLGFILGIWGIVRLFGSMRRLALPLFLILILNLFSILYFEDYYIDNYDLHGYLLFSVALFTLFMVISMGVLSDYLGRLLKNRVSSRPRISRALIVAVVAAVIIFMPLNSNLFSANLSHARGSEEFAEIFLNDAPDGALVITSHYNTYFCLLAYNSLNRPDGGRVISNLYNWDHEWARLQTADKLGINYSEPIRRSDFYRNLLNSTKDERPIYVEYDEGSAPLAKFLRPEGLGYIFSLADTTLSGESVDTSAVERYLSIYENNRDIESTRMWVLWFINRGKFFAARGLENLSQKYYNAADVVASMSEN